MVPRPRPGKAAIALIGLAVLALAAGGCGVVKGAVSTVRALDRAGFASSDIRSSGGGTFAVTVRKDVEDLDSAAAEAAGVVWRELPLRVERLEVECGNGFGGKGIYAADRAELEQRFGSRDPELDRGFRESDVRTVVLVVVGLLVGGLAVLGAIAVLIVVLVRRSRRRGPHGPPGPLGPGGEVSQPPPPHYGPPT